MYVDYDTLDQNIERRPITTPGYSRRRLLLGSISEVRTLRVADRNKRFIRAQRGTV